MVLHIRDVLKFSIQEGFIVDFIDLKVVRINYFLIFPVNLQEQVDKQTRGRVIHPISKTEK